jgi:hypothetical protein
MGYSRSIVNQQFILNADERHEPSLDDCDLAGETATPSFLLSKKWIVRRNQKRSTA